MEKAIWGDLYPMVNISMTQDEISYLRNLFLAVFSQREKVKKLAKATVFTTEWELEKFMAPILDKISRKIVA